MEKNTDNLNIESYEGSDANYEGSDKDYEDFLKKVDGNTDTAANASDVEEDGSVPAGETINIKGVIDMVRKKAGEGWNTAKKIGGGVKVQINDYIAAANERAEEKNTEEKLTEEINTPDAADETVPDGAEIKSGEDATDESGISGISASISSTAKAAKSHIKSVSSAAKEKLDNISLPDFGLEKISSDLEAMSARIYSISSKINEIEVKQIENKNNYDRGINDLRVSINSMSGDISEVKQSTGSILKLNDAVFDLKNTQQNTKKAIADVEARVIALRKKLVAGVTVMSILSVIIIVLEIINLLS